MKRQLRQKVDDIYQMRVDEAKKLNIEDQFNKIAKYLVLNTVNEKWMDHIDAITELKEGIVKLYSVARDAGSRSKVAVYSDNPRVDAIGACIGERSSRISRIMKELKGEKLDIVLYDKDPAVFIKNALSPAKNVNVLIMDPKESVAMAVADGDQLSLAIGKKGQNVRLASRLTKYKIDVKTSAELKELGINISFE